MIPRLPGRRRLRRGPPRGHRRSRWATGGASARTTLGRGTAGEDKPEPAKAPAKPAKPAKPKADKANGRALFMAKCKTCHGGDGKGDTSFGRKLGVPPLSGLGKSKIQSAVVSGVPGTKMKSYKKKFTNKEIDDVVAFVRGL